MPTIEKIPLTEVAKLVRAALKQRFPGTTFSVRSNRYSGGSSIDVSWTDGPTDRQVRRVCSLYEGADFDGREDLKTHHDTLLISDSDQTPRLVSLGVDFVMPSRRISPEWKAELEAEIAAFDGKPFAEWSAYSVAVHENATGGARLAMSGSLTADGGQLVHRLSCLRERFGICVHDEGGYICGSEHVRCCGCGTMLV